MNKLLQILSSLTGQKHILPFYHAVGDESASHLKHLYRVRSSEQFEQDILFLKGNYTSIPSAGNNPLNAKRTFHLSFDDGLRTFKTRAWPILKKHGLTATLFINPSFVGNKAMFYRLKASLLVEHVQNIESIVFANIHKIAATELANKKELTDYILAVNYAEKDILDVLAKELNFSFDNYLEENKPYLDLDELKTLQKEGVLIGAHSMDHPLFHKLSFQEQYEQIKQSIAWVQEYLATKERLFSFPFTDYGIGKRLFQVMDQEFEINYSFGTAGLKNEYFPTHLQRIPMENNRWSALRILLIEYVYYIVKAPLFKNSVRRK